MWPGPRLPLLPGGGLRALTHSSSICCWDWGFLKTFFIPVTLHMIWDGPWATPFDVHLIGLGIIGWFIVFGVVQQGLRQIRDEQLALSPARTLTAALPNVPTLGHPVLVSTDATAS